MKELNCPACKKPMQLQSNESSNHRQFYCDDPDCKVGNIHVWTKGWKGFD